MSLVLSAPKIVLLAVHLAAKADLDSLSFIAANNGSVLRKELLLRVLLTYLPETLKSEEYVSFVQEVETGEYATHEHWEVDVSDVERLSEEEAVKKVRKLYLLKLSWPDAPTEAEEDPLTLFLLRRAYRVDEEAGLLTQLPDLLAPFLGHSAYLLNWTISVLLPLLRRNCEYYPKDSVPITLAEFEQLGDAAAVDLLLSQTGTQEDYTHVGFDRRNARKAQCAVIKNRVLGLSINWRRMIPHARLVLQYGETALRDRLRHLLGSARRRWEKGAQSVSWNQVELVQIRQ